MWRDYPLSVFAFEEPNAYREELGRRLVWSDTQVARALEDDDTARLAELKTYRKQLRELLQWPGYGQAPEIPKPPGYAPPAPVDEPPPLSPHPDELMSDYGPVGGDNAPYPGIPDDFGQLMTGDETLEQAVERMTLGVDELLDMATVLSDPSLELALCAVPPERVNEWTEKLIAEKARLRRLRGTVDENFGRENLVSRVQNMFAQVGAKR